MPTYTFTVDSKGQISDGYHTFDELYQHRAVLFATICNAYAGRAWKSLKHHDNTMYEDYFIVGIHTPMGQFTYHYPMSDWDMFNVPAIEYAPEWDGHTSNDVTRLLSLDGTPTAKEFEMKITLNLDEDSLEEEYQRHRATLVHMQKEVLQELDRFLDKHESDMCESEDYKRIVEQTNELKQFKFGKMINETVCDMVDTIRYTHIPLDSMGTALRVVRALKGITEYTHLEEDN